MPGIKQPLTQVGKDNKSIDLEELREKIRKIDPKEVSDSNEYPLTEESAKRMGEAIKNGTMRI